MFSELYNVVFVGLGEAFGYLTVFANLPWSTFLDLLSEGAVPIAYSNLFTGELIGSISFPLGFIGDILSFLGLISTPLSLYNAPTYAVMIYHSFGIFIMIALFKFLKGVFT